MGGALNDLGGGAGATGREQERGGEGLDQTDGGDNGLAVGPNDGRSVRIELELRHILVEHGVAEAIDRIGELGDDGGVEMDVGVAEQMDGGRYLARELLEHEVLVLRLGAELGSLEQALTVPLVVLDPVSEVGAGNNPLERERGVAIGKFATDQLLDLLD